MCVFMYVSLCVCVYKLSSKSSDDGDGGSGGGGDNSNNGNGNNTINNNKRHARTSTHTLAIEVNSSCWFASVLYVHDLYKLTQTNQPKKAKIGFVQRLRSPMLLCCVVNSVMLLLLLLLLSGSLIKQIHNNGKNDHLKCSWLLQNCRLWHVCGSVHLTV